METPTQKKRMLIKACEKSIQSLNDAWVEGSLGNLISGTIRFVLQDDQGMECHVETQFGMPTGTIDAEAIILPDIPDLV